MEHRQHISYLDSCALCIFIQIKKAKKKKLRMGKKEDDVGAKKIVELYKLTYVVAS